jgi:glucose/arabinose dehydrogenase
MRNLTFAVAAIVTGFVADDVAAQGAAQAAAELRSARVEGHLVQPRQLEWTPSFVDALHVPAGFRISVFASSLAGAPRMLAVGQDGTVYVTRRDSADVLALTDADGDGRAERTRKVVTSLPHVHGIAIHDGTMYLATIREVYAATVRPDGSVDMPRRIVDDLPEGGQHPNRTLAVGADGMLYVSVGSTCNNCVETNPENATLLRMRTDGSQRGVYARGLRNLIGWDWHPVTGRLWGMDHGSDWRGDDLPPEELNRIENATHYGWPFCYADRQVDAYTAAAPPDGDRAGFCRRTAAPVLTYTAHAAPIGMVFYDADHFPAEYRGDAFVAMRGSWNREPPSGYRILRVRFDAGGEATGLEDFVTGFLTEDGAAFRGRIAGIAVASDGALLVSDDANGVIYRVSFGQAPGR